MDEMIRAEKLDFLYEQSKDGIKDVDFSIKGSEVILLAGTSAAANLLCSNALTV